MRVSLASIAARLMTEANEYWQRLLGPHTVYSGFQVEPVGLDELSGQPLFKSTLYGGRYMIGSEREVKWSLFAYVRAKRPKGKRR